MTTDPVQLFRGLIENVRPQGNGQFLGTCPCPDHTDRNPSFSFGPGDTQAIVFKCLAGCEQDTVLESLDLTWADILGGTPNGHHKKAAPKRDTSTKSAKPPPAIYESFTQAVAAAERQIGVKQTETRVYQLANGDEHFRVVRFNLPGGGKEFRPFHKAGQGWVMKDPEAPLSLYRLPKLAAAKPGSTILLVEGEGCAEAASDIGFELPTTSAHGCKAPRSTDWSPLAKHRVWILPDADSGGGKYAQTVAGICSSLDPATVEIKVVPLPDLEPGGDIVDFIQSRRMEAKDDAAIVAEIEALAEQAPVWTPKTAIVHSPPPVIDAIGPYQSHRESMNALNRMGNTSRKLRETESTLSEQIAEWLDRKGVELLDKDYPIPYAAAIVGVTRCHFHRLGQVGRIRRLLRASNTPVALSDRAIIPLARLLPGHAEAIPKAIESAGELVVAEARERHDEKVKPVSKRHTVAAVDSIIGPVPPPPPPKRFKRQRPVETADEQAVEMIRRQIEELTEAVASVSSVPGDLRTLILRVGKHYWSIA